LTVNIAPGEVITPGMLHLTLNTKRRETSVDMILSRRYQGDQGSGYAVLPPPRLRQPLHSV
jgi:hypothetical protein